MSATRKTGRSIARLGGLVAMIACAAAVGDAADLGPDAPRLPTCTSGFNPTNGGNGMSHDERTTPHRMIWADLATPDDAAAAAFYEALFGWRAVRRAAGGGEYTTYERDGRAIASAYRLPPSAVELGVPAHWIPYVSTPDVDATAAAVERLGGRVVVRATSYPGLARIAVIAAPDGALLGLWQGGTANAAE